MLPGANNAGLVLVSRPSCALDGISSVVERHEGWDKCRDVRQRTRALVLCVTSFGASDA